MRLAACALAFSLGCSRVADGGDPSDPPLGEDPPPIGTLDATAPIDAHGDAGASADAPPSLDAPSLAEVGSSALRPITPRAPEAVDVVDPTACHPPVTVEAACGLGAPKDAGQLVATTSFPFATLLADGRVLLIGGRRTQIYDPACDRWSLGAPPATSRVRSGWHATSMVTLADGRVVLVGQSGDGKVQTSETYDPVTDRWTAPATLAGMAYVDAAARLPDGRAIAAGETSGPVHELVHAVYDPATNTWAPFPNPALPTGTSSRASVAFALPGGEVHEIYYENATVGEGTLVTRAARWDGKSGAWTMKASPPMGQGGADFVLPLPDGRIALVMAEGWASSLYDPVIDSYAPAAPGMPLFGTATLLPCGQVLVLGENEAHLWDPVAHASDGVFIDAPKGRPRKSHATIVLRDGSVLVTGGGYTYFTIGFQTSEVRR